MADHAAILRCCDALGATVDALNALVKQTKGDRRHALIALRKQLSTHIAALHDTGSASGSAFAGGHLGQEFRRRYSAMRSAVALHQASHPAVALNDAGESYSVSSTAVSAKIRDTIAWVRAMARETP